MARMRKGADWQAQAMGANAGYQGTATATTATSLTATGTPWVTDAFKGSIVAVGPNVSGTGSTVYGVVLTNSTSVLTVDKWYVPATPGGAAGTTPNATSLFQILPGAAPAWWISFTETAAAPVDTDTQLAGELVVGTSGGLQRQIATYAHTTATSGASSTYTLTLTNATLTTATPRTLQKIAVTNSAVDSANQLMAFETAIPSPPTLVQNDQITLTETVTI